MRSYAFAVLALAAATFEPAAVEAAYGWAQARTSLGRSLGDVLYESPNHTGRQHRDNIRDFPENGGSVPASRIRIWLDADCELTANLAGRFVRSWHGAVNGDFTATFDEMILECSEGTAKMVHPTVLPVQTSTCNSLPSVLATNMTISCHVVQCKLHLQPSTLKHITQCTCFIAPQGKSCCTFGKNKVCHQCKVFDNFSAPGLFVITLLHADTPVYSFEGDDWSGTIPALEYGGFLPVGGAKLLPGYDGPHYGLATRDDKNGGYGKCL